MNGPKIYLIKRTDGDGYGHNSYEYGPWYVDEREAERAVAELEDGAVHRFFFEILEVESGSPMLERGR